MGIAKSPFCHPELDSGSIFLSFRPMRRNPLSKLLNFKGISRQARDGKRWLRMTKKSGMIILFALRKIYPPFRPWVTAEHTPNTFYETDDEAVFFEGFF